MNGILIALTLPQAVDVAVFPQNDVVTLNTEYRLAYYGADTRPTFAYRHALRRYPPLAIPENDYIGVSSYDLLQTNGNPALKPARYTLTARQSDKGVNKGATARGPGLRWVGPVYLIEDGGHLDGGSGY